MPEYLSPAVYVEEVSGGVRPIEGVSTSTGGMVGVTERGPENVPVLCTSIGDYRRIFGDRLNLRDFVDPTGIAHGHTFDAVKAFFENGGRRNFVVRVASPAAARAERGLFDRGGPAPAETFLLRAAPQDSGTAINTPLVYALQSAPALAVNDIVRVGDGSRSEYREITALGAEIHVALNAPLSRAHAAGVAVDEVDYTVDVNAYVAGTFALDQAANAGALTVDVTAQGALADAATLLGLPGDALIEIGNPLRSEFRFATAAEDLGGGVVRVTLADPLAMDHDAGVDANAIELVAPNLSQALGTAAGAGESLIYLDTLAGGFPTAGGEKLVVLDPGAPNAEVRRIGALGEMTFDLPAYADYGAGSRLDLVTLNDDRDVVAGTQRVFTATTVAGLAVGMEISVDGNPAVVIDAIDLDINQITTRTDALPANPVGGEAIVVAPKAMTGDATAGTVVLSLDNRLGLAPDDVIRIGAGANTEFAIIAAVMGNRGVAPDAGSIILSAPLARDHATGTQVVWQNPPVIDPVRQPAFVLADAEAGAAVVHATDARNYVAPEIVMVNGPGGATYFHTLGNVDATLTGIEVTLDAALDLSHDLGADLARREEVIRVVALDRGAWGNRLRVAVRDAETPLVQANLTASSALNPLIELSNYTGVEPGTVLEYFDPATGATVGDLSKVVRVDRAAGEVELAAVPDPAVTGAAIPLSVRSREFEIIVNLLQEPDPAVPSRNNRVQDSETFLVSMDPRHSMYLHTVIGTTWVPGAADDDDGNPLRPWDLRSEGASDYIRVRDVAAGNIAITHTTRLGPEPLQDVLVNGLTQEAMLALAAGTDATGVMSPAMYQGIDSNEPRVRTGIHALQNEQTISIVAVPGQTTFGVQQALINHCERDRYRFAILDGPPPPNDTLVDVQLLRQQFDTNYAAMYHSWVTIPDPLPGNLAAIQQIALPPSGHVMGVYARTDNDRGVHKAPANEPVNGITGLSRTLNQREHDILNPFPVNINVIRDFRRTNRGIRVWGARCITSDSQFKYVNVRRLFIFVSESIERGLQYAVFEPNAEPLWSQVTRSVRSFLTVVWRNGALEGTSPEQAFFVRCDRTTMTQTDIDEGRLIMLVGIAPVKPAEFVIVRISQKTLTAPQ